MFGEHANARLHTFYSKSSPMAVPECRETAVEHPVENEPVKLLTRAQLASIWAISPKTLANWEGAGVGPPPNCEETLSGTRRRLLPPGTATTEGRQPDGPRQTRARRLDHAEGEERNHRRLEGMVPVRRL